MVRLGYWLYANDALHEPTRALPAYGASAPSPTPPGGDAHRLP